MKKIIMAMILVFMSSLTQAMPITSNEPVESYTAKLGEKDHFNSNGERLKSAAAILRQDRANYYEFNIVDPEDEESGNDSLFAKKENRAKLEAMLKRGSMSKATEKEIVNGTPVVRVTVYKNHIEVSLK